MSAAGLMLLAWAIEAAFGWPQRLFSLIKHPVVWIGALISFLETTLNRTAFAYYHRYFFGVLTTIIVVGLAVIIALLTQSLLPKTAVGFGITAVLASSLIASRSLYEHVAEVAKPLMVGDIKTSREAVSKIVGRDPSHLDSAAIARASLESLAENASDGVIAPLFYGAFFGLPGIAAYKAVNTLDSMIAHRNPRYLAFGGFAARLDDICNFIPARLTGLLFAAMSMSMSAYKAMMQDARKHRSPNAGWPESSIAGALGVRLSGPRQYGDSVAQEPWLNQNSPDPIPFDVNRGLYLYVKTMVLAAVLIAMMAVMQATL